MADASDEDDFLAADILGDAGETTDLETAHQPDPRALRRQAKLAFARVAQTEALRDVIRTPPAPGESIHVISGSKFDFWTWVPAMVEWIGRADHLYCSTWTASRQNVVELLELYDAGRIGPIAALTGTYFKRRETAVYTVMVNGIRARGGRFKAFQNHAKVLLLDAPAAGHWLTVEGSANLTSNPRAEQCVITNDRALWDFYRTWFEEVLAA